MKRIILSVFAVALSSAVLSAADAPKNAAEKKPSDPAVIQTLRHQVAELIVQIAAAQVAAQRAKNEHVRHYAKEIADSYEDEATRVGRVFATLPAPANAAGEKAPAEKTPESSKYGGMQARLGKLVEMEGDEFDRHYIFMQVGMLETAILHNKWLVKHANHAEIKKWAGDTTRQWEAEQRLQKAQQIANSLINDDIAPAQTQPPSSTK